jgi:hypothetical protein
LDSGLFFRQFALFKPLKLVLIRGHWSCFDKGSGMKHLRLIGLSLLTICSGSALAASAPDLSLKPVKGGKYEIVIRGQVARSLYMKLPVKAEVAGSASSAMPSTQAENSALVPAQSPAQVQGQAPPPGAQSVKTINMMACTEFTPAGKSEPDFTCSMILSRDGEMTAVKRTHDSGGMYAHARSETSGEGLRIFFGEKPAKKLFGVLNDPNPRDKIRSAGDVSCTKDDSGEILCAIDVGKTAVPVR